MQGQAPARAPFAFTQLQAPLLETIAQLAQSARGFLSGARPAAAPQHDFDDDDEVLQDILAQFPDADPEN